VKTMKTIGKEGGHPSDKRTIYSKKDFFPERNVSTQAKSPLLRSSLLKRGIRSSPRLISSTSSPPSSLLMLVEAVSSMSKGLGQTIREKKDEEGIERVKKRGRPPKKALYSTMSLLPEEGIRGT